MNPPSTSSGATPLKVVKFDPRNGFANDITGESGCANCGHPLEHSAPECPNSHLICTMGGHGDCLYLKTRNEGNCNCHSPQPKKMQTIRAKPIEVGSKIALWEMKRYMLKGQYCTGCWKQTGFHNVLSSKVQKYIPWEKCVCGKNEKIIFPRLLLKATIKECVPIELKWEEDQTLDVKINGRYLESIEQSGALGQSIFVNADTPNWTNKQFIDFFRKTYPDIEKGWVPFWIWRWGP